PAAKPAAPRGGRTVLSVRADPNGGTRLHRTERLPRAARDALRSGPAAGGLAAPSVPGGPPVPRGRRGDHHGGPGASRRATCRGLGGRSRPAAHPLYPSGARGLRPHDPVRRGEAMTGPENAGMPAVSVVMAVCNAEPWLVEAVDSVLGQTFGDFELIAIDDGSVDATPAILKNYRDPRLRGITPPQAGHASTLNHRLRPARGAGRADRADGRRRCLPPRAIRPPGGLFEGAPRGRAPGNGVPRDFCERRGTPDHHASQRRSRASSRPDPAESLHALVDDVQTQCPRGERLVRRAVHRRPGL